MRVNRTIWIVTVLVFVLATTLLGPAPAAQAAAPCGAGKTEPVTFLARNGLNRDWVRVPEKGIAPYLDVERQQTMVGVRNLLTTLSENGTAKWDNDTRTASFTFGSRILAVKFPEGQLQTSTAFVNGQPYHMNAFICNGTVVAPARAVTDAFRVGLVWYRDNTIVADPTWAYTGPEVAPAAKPAFQARIVDTMSVYKVCEVEEEYTGIWAPLKRLTRATACYLKRL